MSDIGAIIGVILGGLAVLTALWHLVRAGYRLARTGEKVLDRIDALERTLNNGIRTQIFRAADEAGEARQLAGQAAATSAVAEQRAEDALRAVRALAGTVDAFVNTYVSDQADLWTDLREAGIDRRHRNG